MSGTWKDFFRNEWQDGNPAENKKSDARTLRQQFHTTEEAVHQAAQNADLSREQIAEYYEGETVPVIAAYTY